MTTDEPSGNKAALLRLAHEISTAYYANAGIPSPEEIGIDPALVPEGLRDLIAHAGILGVGDDGARSELVDALPREYMLLAANDVDAHGDRLSVWLVSAENSGPEYSAEWLALTCLGQAVAYFRSAENVREHGVPRLDDAAWDKILHRK